MIFIDTWGWLALGHRKDSHHREVLTYYKELRNNHYNLFTSDYVLNETISLVFKREYFEEAVQFIEGILQGAKESYLTIETVTQEHFNSAWKMRKKFNDKPRISFTDITSMVIMKEKGIDKVLTQDEHFTHVGMGFHIFPHN